MAQRPRSLARRLTSPILGICLVAACGDDPTGPISSAFQAIAAGLLHSCGVSSDGTAYCWGWNRDGQVGDGSKDDRSRPARVRAGDVLFDAIAPGGGHTCALDPQGNAFCWGFNLNGQLGDGSNATRTAVARVSGDLRFVQLTAGSSYTCGLTDAGATYCWGWNAAGQLGDGTQTDRTTPVAASGDLVFSTISAASSHTCGVTPDGDAYCWGENGEGQLGDGTTIDRGVPTLVSGGPLFQSIQTGFMHTCGLTVDGEVLCWGANGGGQLGDGTVVGHVRPAPVNTSLRFAQIAIGAGNFTCGVTTDGDAYCWGLNNGGQLGSESPDLCSDPDSGLQAACSVVPLAVSGGLRFQSVSAGTQHTCGLATDNLAYCWGFGNRGQLGNGQSGEGTLVVQPTAVAGQPSSS